MYVYVGQAKSFSLQNYFSKNEYFQTIYVQCHVQKDLCLKPGAKQNWRIMRIGFGKKIALRDDDTVRVMHLRTC